ncbi:SRPBCC family protein [Nocardia jejuensis]|uniref:SRPBCC family protein n=1 Tax=Nocardia jejuensis TaxID=328049 RepID=UPI003BB5C471
MHETAVIDAPPEQVWAALRALDEVHLRLLPGYVLDSRMDGDIRYLTLPSGQVIRELIVTVDDEARRLAYSAVAGFQLPIQHHHASFQVFEEIGDRTRLVWITDVLPHPAAEGSRIRIVRALEVMRETLEQSVIR